MSPDRKQAGGDRPAAPVVTVNIFGVDYAVRGGADPEYIYEVAAHVDRVMRDIAGRVKNVSATKIAVLAALQMTDQLYSERREKLQDQKQIAERTDSLLSRLDQTLLEVVE
jgi:cell division protein ZapA